MATVTDLVTEFKFTGNTAPLKNYNMGLGEAIGLLGGIGVAMAAAGAAMAKWATGVLEGEQALINLSAETGVAVERLQELAYAAEVSNSSTEALNSSMTGLSAKIGEAAQKGSEDFGRLGISVRDASGQVKSADRVFAEIGQRFQQMNLSMAEQRSFLEAFGIDPSMVTLLNRTSSEMDKLLSRARDLGTLTEKQVKFAQDYNDSIATLRFAFDGLQRITAVGLGPALKDLAELFTDLIVENKDWIANGLQAAFGVIADFMKALNRLAPVILGIGTAFLVAKVAALGFSGVMGIILSPIVVVTAAVVAALLVIDDLIVAFRGGKSIIRDFFQEFLGVDITPILQNMVAQFTKAISSIWELFKGLFDGITDLFVGDFESAFQKITAAFSNFFRPMIEATRNALASLLPDWANNLLGLDTVGQNATGQSMAFSGGSSIVNNSGGTVQQNVDMKIVTSDPERAGQAASDGLQRQMEDAQTQSRRGGM